MMGRLPTDLGYPVAFDANVTAPRISSRSVNNRRPANDRRHDVLLGSDTPKFATGAASVRTHVLSVEFECGVLGKERMTPCPRSTRAPVEFPGEALRPSPSIGSTNFDHSLSISVTSRSSVEWRYMP